MTQSESTALITTTAARFGVTNLITSDYQQRLIQESGGHPYVMKIMIGEVARSGKILDIRRVIAAKDEMLRAMFERTYATLSAGAERILLVLASWNSPIARVILEAVMLRPEVERFDAEAAIDELWKLSLINVLEEGENGVEFLSLPVAARAFAQKKLKTSPQKFLVDADRAVVLEFGPVQHKGLSEGLGPHVSRVINRIARESEDDATFRDVYISLLEYVAIKNTSVWLELSELHETLGDRDRAIDAVRRYIEESEGLAEEFDGYQRLARLYRGNGDTIGEIAAVVASGECEAIDLSQISAQAANLNSLLREGQLVDVIAKRKLVGRLAVVMAEKIRDGEPSATDCSRLAWLYLHMQNEGEAKKMTLRGLMVDRDNEHCRNLAVRLNLLS